jgi:hypothetical protein
MGFRKMTIGMRSGSLGALILFMSVPGIGLAQEAETPTPAAEEASTEQSASYVPQDLAPTIEVYRNGDQAVSIGASTQIWGIPYLGEDALVANDDPSDNVGFRARRVRFGIQGDILKNVRFGLTLNALGSGDDIVHDVRLSWRPMDEIGLSIGSAKVPYGRSALESSSRLHFVDRPLGTGEVAIGNRLGLTIEGALFGGALGYVVGVYNAGSRFANGNESKGLLTGGRIESAPFGPAATLRPGDFRMVLGGGALYEDGPTVNTLAYSGDLHLEFQGFRLRGEYLADQREPDTQPQLPPTISGRVDRTVIIAEATAFIYCDLVELAFRYERYDNNKGLDDYGDQQVFAGGVNWYVDGHRLKVLAHFTHRDEVTDGWELDNDAFVVSMVGAL